MDLTHFSLQVLLFFFPGLLAFGMFSTYTYKQERRAFEIVILVFVLGILSYLVVDAVRWVLLCDTRSDPGYLEMFLFQEQMPAFGDIIKVSLAGIFVGSLTAAFYNKKIIHRIGKKLGLTKRFGEPDVWAYLHESKDVEWVTIRDFEFNLTYHGWVSAYGDTSENPELLLSEVQVYERLSGEFMYEVDAIYLTRPLDKISIEVQKLNE